VVADKQVVASNMLPALNSVSLHKVSELNMLALGLVFLAASGPLGIIFPKPTESAYTPQTLSATLIVQTAPIEVSPGNTITMWTYNGTVPGPLLRANVGDTLLVTLKNQHTLKHSLHVHGLSHDIASDGSQGDPGISDLGIISLGQQYTYTFTAERPGLYAYHCHSDDTYEPSVHVQQGLYGAIIVNDPAKPLPTPNREYVLFLGEAYGQVSFSMFHGCAYCFGNSKFFTINARQMPLTPTLTARPGELVRIYLINVGNDIHSFHLHGHQMSRWRVINGEWASVVVRNDNKGFVPMEAAIVDIRAQSPGRWLYHCHVEPHADTGMMGVFEVLGGPAAIRDLSIKSIQVPPAIYPDQLVAINSELANEGEVSELFLAETFASNGAAIGEAYVSWINPASSALLTVFWNTGGLTPGTYQITAQIPLVPSETDSTDNFYSITVTVRMTGDVDGDNDVDILDAARLAYAFGSTVGSPLWDPYSDFDGNGVIDILDAARLAFHFGESA